MGDIIYLLSLVLQTVCYRILFCGMLKFKEGKEKLGGGGGGLSMANQLWIC